MQHWTLAAWLLMAGSFTLRGGAASAADQLALKDAFAQDFRVGAALSTPQVMGEEPAALELVAEQFNTITPENLLKWAEVHPQPEQYHFEPADKYVAFGEKHGMFIVGHNLVWHNQTPTWVFEGENGQPLSRELLLKRMQEHIQTVVGRYKGRIKGWDVVNEGIEDDGRMRTSPWQKIIGDDYIEKAFQFAHEADPDAELYYNDYNEWHPAKRQSIGRLVRSLKAKGVRIDGLGLQGHWSLDYPKPAEINAMFADYGKLGLKLMVTELDINLLPRPDGSQGADVSRTFAGDDKLNPYAKGLPPEMGKALAERYRTIFQAFERNRDKLDRVTFWGVHDGQSWLNNWPVRGRTSYPLLFDRQLKPKPAFQAVVETAKADGTPPNNATPSKTEQRTP
jgi:endo-1,4-beta-xylanase